MADSQQTISDQTRRQSQHASSYAEPCEAVSVDTGKFGDVSCHSVSELQAEVGHLRARLTRRNDMLDAVARAYHIDVLRIRDHLKDIQDSGKSEITTRIADLDRIPSLDLRPSLKLFAPSECEMRLKPCDRCGGVVEIVHKESAKLRRLRAALIEKEDIENHLSLQCLRHGIERAQSKIHVDTLAAEKRREQQILVTQIDRLKQTLVQNETAVEEAHDALQVFDDMRLDLEAYKQSLKQFNDVNNMLAKSNMSVALQKAHISCLKCNIEDFDQQLEKAALVEGGLKNEIKNLSAELSALRESYVGQEREIYNLKTTIEEERGHVSRLRRSLEVSEEREASLQVALTQSVSSHQAYASDSNTRHDSVSKKLEITQAQLVKKEAEVASYVNRLKVAFRKHADNDAKRKDHVDNLQAQRKILYRDLASVVQCVHSHCAAQEQLFRSESHGLDILVDFKDSTEFHDDSVSHCDAWERDLDNEQKRLLYMQQLGKRQNFGLRKLESLVTSIRNNAANTIRESELDSVSKIQSLNKAHTSAIASVEGLRQEAVREIATLKEQLKISHERNENVDADAQRMKLNLLDLKMRYEEKCSDFLDLGTKSNQQSNQIQQMTNALHEERHASKIQAQAADELRSSFEDERIKSKSVSQCLEQLSQRFCALLEAEEYRLETNKHVGTQFTGHSCEIGVQADFMPTSSNFSTGKGFDAKALLSKKRLGSSQSSGGASWSDRRHYENSRFKS